MTVYVVPIVEGQTEAGCVERLLQRIWTELLASPGRLQVLLPSRGKRDLLVRRAGIELAEKFAEAFTRLSQRLRNDPSASGLVLLLLDAEGDCPAELGPRLLGVARNALPAEAPVACVVAKRMFENWIVAGASTLGGVNGLPATLPVVSRCEELGGAAWLEAQLRSRDRRRKYKKTDDAEVFVRRMNLQECRANSPSFDKLCRDLEARVPQPPPTEGDPGA